MKAHHTICLLISGLALASASSFLHPSDQSPVWPYGASVPGGNTLTYCDDPKDDVLDILSVDFYPLTPSFGQLLTVNATGITTGPVVSGATVTLTVKLQLNPVVAILLLKKTADICEQLEEDDGEVKCPISNGKKLEFSRSIEIPGNAPSGKYLVHIDAITENGARITCLDTEVTH